MNVASIDTGDPDRDAHLLSPDFFDAERYPEMRFESTRIQHVDGATYRVAGDLTIKDQTREVELDGTVEGSAEDPWGNERVGVSILGRINRTDFGASRGEKARDRGPPRGRGGQDRDRHLRRPRLNARGGIREPCWATNLLGPRGLLSRTQRETEGLNAWP